MIRVGRRALKISPLSLALLGAASLAVCAAALRPVDAGAPAAMPGAPPPDRAGRATGDTGAAVARPLFDPERRAWTARGSREDLTAEAPPPTLLSVRGILIQDRVRRALVADGTDAPAWLAPGEGRGAWRLVAIEPTQVVVADAGRHYTLAFLGPPVALRPAPRHPARDARSPDADIPNPEAADLRPTLGPGDAAAPAAPATTAPVTTAPATGAPPSAARVRRIEITRPAIP